MNISQRIQTFVLFLLTVIATGCSNEDAHNSFLKANGIEETDKVPRDYTASGWKPLAGNYVYFIDLFNLKNSPELIYILADKKENKLLSAYHINPQVIPASYALGVKPPTAVTNYQEINGSDLERSDDMTGLNALIKTIPELKNFSWKDELQNTIISSIIFKTHFIYVITDSVDDNLFHYRDTPVKQDQSQLLKRIFSGKYFLFNRPVKRLNEDVEMNQYVKELGFFRENDTFLPTDKNTKRYYINDLLKNPINFKTRGKLCLFYPFKSFIRVQDKGGSPFYDPAVATYEYSFIPDSEGFPKFKRITQFASLLKR